jgi:hypothetical protein
MPSWRSGARWRHRTLLRSPLSNLPVFLNWETRPSSLVREAPSPSNNAGLVDLRSDADPVRELGLELPRDSELTRRWAGWVILDSLA